MSEKKDKNKTVPFTNEITMMKEEVKKKIDDMTPEEFLNMLGFLMMGADGLEDDGSEYEELEEDDEENPFEVPIKNNIRNFPIRNNEDIPF